MISTANEHMINPTDQAELVWIPDGDFTMGSTDADIALILQQHPGWRPEWFAQEKPQRSVWLPGFWMYTYPVTVAQYRAYCLATEETMPDAPEWGWQDDHPIVNVNWQDITRYAAWAHAAIPTEAQWEKAARGVDGRRWPWGDTWVADNCVHGGNAVSTAPVGTYPANRSPFGVMDMIGNIWEWCLASPEGEYDGKPARTPPRRVPTASGHVLRGGSWQCAFDAYLSCTYRCFECDILYTRTAHCRPTTGFRCAVTTDQIG